MDKSKVINAIRQELEEQQVPCGELEEQPGLQWFLPLSEAYEQDYHFVLRPYQKFCEAAAKMMYQLSKEHSSGIRSRQNAIYLQSYVTGT